MSDMLRVKHTIEMPTQTQAPTDMEKLQAQIDYLSMMTGVDL